MRQLIKKALIPYSIGEISLEIEKELHMNSWNGDLHYKIMADGVRYSARFLSDHRSPNRAFGDISNDVLYEQTKFSRFLRKNGIPFMRLVPVFKDKPFSIVEWNSESYRFILFEWIEGQHISHCDENIAEEFGKVAREIHDISSAYHTSAFSKTSHLVGYSQFVEELTISVNPAAIPEGNMAMIRRYIKNAKHHLEVSMTRKYDFIIQTD